MQYQKISSELLTALDDYKTQGRKGLTKHMLSIGIVSTTEEYYTPKPPRIVVFLRCKQDAQFDDLAKSAIRINQPTGVLRTAILPLDSLDPLSENDDVQQIIPSRYLNLLMDVAPQEVRLPEFLNRTEQQLTGSGVIVGVVDTGIDPNHPAFAGRILRIWDQDLSGPGVLEGGYGVELSGSSLTVSRDTVGHGTHVAGIAAGSDELFGGVAPGSEIIIVKTTLRDAHIADGIRYILRVAQEMGRPAVVNLSLGGHGDAHDGSDPLSKIIDSEVGPGRIVCCAAGNEGNDNIHAQVMASQGSTKSARFLVPNPLAFRMGSGEYVRYVALNGWYSGDDSVRIALRSPSGYRTPYQDLIAAGNPVRSYYLPDAAVRIATPAQPDIGNGDRNFLIEITNVYGPTLAATSGTWQLLLEGSDIRSGSSIPVDIWTVDDSRSLDVVFTGTSVKDSMKIGSPGASSEAITVASYTTKANWKDIDAMERVVALSVDTISDFSSEGPLRKGNQKPDVAAPGAMITAPLSSDSAAVARSNIISPKYRVNAGTSMATPFIAGMVALLLQRDRNLDPSGVKALLHSCCEVPGQPDGTFDTKWGRGLINCQRLP